MNVERRTQLDGRAVALIGVCCAIWGLNQATAKLALAEVPPLLQAGARSLGAAALVAAWARLRGIDIGWRDGTLGAGLAAGAMFAAEFALIFIGLQFTTASRMSVFLYLAPFVVAMGMPFVSRSERLVPLQLAGLAAAFGGVAWAFGEAFGESASQAPARQWLGDVLAVVAAVIWGATTLLVRATALTRATPEKTLLYQLVFSGLALTAASPLAGEHWPQALSATGWALMGFQTVVVCGFSFLLWFWLLRHYPATRVAAFTLLTPILGLLAGVLWLGEPMTLRLGVACAAVAMGIALVNGVRR